MCSDAEMLDELLRLRMEVSALTAELNGVRELRLALQASVATLVLGDPQMFIEECVGAVTTVRPVVPQGPVGNTYESVEELLREVSDDVSRRYSLASNIVAALGIRTQPAQTVLLAESISSAAVKYLLSAGRKLAVSRSTGGVVIYEGSPEDCPNEHVKIVDLTNAQSGRSVDGGTEMFMIGAAFCETHYLLPTRH